MENHNDNDDGNGVVVMNEFLRKISHYYKKIEQIDNARMCKDPSDNDKTLQSIANKKKPLSDTSNNRNQQNANTMISSSIEEQNERSAMILKQQQERLILLKHASKCHSPEGTCPVTSHCFYMQSLWQHVINCKHQKCEYRHCISSRYNNNNNK